QRRHLDSPGSPYTTPFRSETSDPKQVSTAAAEKFLEGAYRLQQIVTPYAFEQLLVAKLDLRDPPPASFPPEAAFLDEIELRDERSEEHSLNSSHVETSYAV